MADESARPVPPDIDSQWKTHIFTAVFLCLPSKKVYTTSSPDAWTSGLGVRLRFPSLWGLDAQRLCQDATTEDVGLDPTPPLHLVADA